MNRAYVQASWTRAGPSLNISKTSSTGTNPFPIKLCTNITKTKTNSKQISTAWQASQTVPTNHTELSMQLVLEVDMMQGRLEMKPIADCPTAFHIFLGCIENDNIE